MKNKTKITSTILLSALLLGVAVTSMNFQTAFAGPPPPSAVCGETILVDTVQTADLNCTAATGGITIGAVDVELDLNGWDINCADAGFMTSCQGLGTIGVDQNGFTGMTVTGPGTINGFAFAVLVDATGANVKDLTITGPVSQGVGNNNRPAAQGIVVTSIECPDDFDTTVNIHGNDIANHREGVAMFGANCVNIHHNVIHDNNSDPVECSGILLQGSSNNKIHANDVFNNGENLSSDAGIILDFSSDNNKIFRNDVTNNNGAGISIRSASTGNTVDHNQVSGHTLFGGDLSEISGSGVNSYLKNCYTTTNIAPAPGMSNKCPIPNAGA